MEDKKMEDKKMKGRSSLGGKLLSCILTFIGVILITSALRAQVTTVTITGYVTDQSGAVVPDAQIIVTEVATRFTRSTRSGGDGGYTLTTLPIGTYTITAEHAGFKKYIRGGFGPLVVAQVARADIALQVGAVTQEITVTTAAPLVPTSVSQTAPLVVNALAMQELPINGRNVLTLINLYPGATVVSYGLVETGNGGIGSANVNGGRDVSMNYRLDGANYANAAHGPQPYPPPDSVEEFNLITHDFSSEYGGNSAAIMEAVIKSGTNAYHGTLWEYNRNTDLNARNTFAANRTALIQNQFGFNAGGPILKDRLFIFGSYQGVRVAQAALLTGALPATTAERNGDFSAEAPIMDPTTGLQFPGNIIPKGRLDPVAQNLFKMMPLPNTPGGLYTTTFSEPLPAYEYTLKGDWDVSSKDRISGRFTHYVSSTVTPSGDYPTYSSNVLSYTMESLGAHWTRNISSSLLNDFVFGLVWDAGNNNNLEHMYATDPAIGVDPSLGNNGTGIFETPPHWIIGGRTTMGGGIGGLSSSRFYDFVDNVTWIKGKHTLKFGAEWKRDHWHNSGGGEDNGIWTFDGYATGNAMADFVIGSTEQFQDNSPYKVRIGEHNYYFFAKDDYKVSRKLTLNLGLRWEINQPPRDIEQVTHRYASATFLPSCPTVINDPFPQCAGGRTSTVFPTAPPGVFWAGDAGVPPGIYKTPLGNFQPRIGFAYDPFGTGKTAIRVAGGKFTESPYTSYGIDLNQPWLLNHYTYGVPMDNPLGGLRLYPFTPPANGAPYTFTLPFNTGGVQPDYHEADVYQWTATVNHEFPKGYALEVSYLGTEASHLIMANEGNPVRYFPGTKPDGTPLSTVSNIEARRIYANLSTMWSMATGANASYHGLQVNLTKRAGERLYMTVGYGLSKAIDLRSGSGLFGAPVEQDPFNYHLEKALANQDRRQVFTFGPVYTSPHLSSMNPVARGFLRDWEVAAVVRATSGPPFTVVDGTDQALQGLGQAGTGVDRPDLVGNPNAISNTSRADSIRHWFNTGAFALGPLGGYGNLGRNTMIGPGFWSADISLVKNIPIRERFKIQLRGEFFNIFNNVNLGTPNNTLTSPAFGRISSAGSPRIGELVMKLFW